MSSHIVQFWVMNPPQWPILNRQRKPDNESMGSFKWFTWACHTILQVFLLINSFKPGVLFMGHRQTA